jgi:hypothetical protein
MGSGRASLLGRGPRSAAMPIDSGKDPGGHLVSVPQRLCRCHRPGRYRWTRGTTTAKGPDRYGQSNSEGHSPITAAVAPTCLPYRWQRHYARHDFREALWRRRHHPALGEYHPRLDELFARAGLPRRNRHLLGHWLQLRARRYQDDGAEQIRPPHLQTLARMPPDDGRDKFLHCLADQSVPAALKPVFPPLL